MSTERTVVGVDGSRESLDAAAWAAADALHRGHSLHIAYAFVWPTVYAPVAGPMPSPSEQGVQEAAADTLAQAAAHARAVAPGLDDMQAQQPAAVLGAASEHACTVVVGNRGRGGFTGLLLGSVGVELAAHAVCPVVIVRHADRPAGPEAGRIVVGIDGSHDAERALHLRR